MKRSAATVCCECSPLRPGVNLVSEQTLTSGRPTKQCKKMASKHQDCHRHWWREEEQNNPLLFGIDPHIRQPSSNSSERQHENLQEIETGAATNTAGKREKLLEAAGRKHHGQHEEAKRQKPLDPM